MKCPTCNRVIRRRKPKVETPEDALKRVAAQAKSSISSRLRKPMPAKTVYKSTAC
jgi:hypothetical protein